MLLNSDKIQFLSEYTANKLPIRENRQLEDLLVYKKNIVLLRNNFNDGFCSLITYVKKKTKQVKQYQIQLHTYYYNRQKNEFVIIAKDVNSNNSFTKTYLLNNVLSVEKSNRKVETKNLKIN